MSLNPSRLSISPAGWVTYGIVEIGLFVIANLTSKSSSHPGTVSNIAFIAFIVGLVLAVALGAATLIHQRRARR
jgi:hypothetical protein